MLAEAKKNILPLLISALCALFIVIDKSNRYNEWLYTFFYSGLFSSLFFVLLRPLNLHEKRKVQVYVVVFLSLLLRIYLFPFQSADFTKNFALWMDEITQQGGMEALKNPFYDYSPPYMYILVLLTKFPFSHLVEIKAASLAFEYGSAFFVFALVHKFRSATVALAAAAVFLFLPTVVLNGALWGQCDSVYTFFLLGYVYFLLENKNNLAFVFVGLAFAFKLQTIFIVLLPTLLFATRQLSFKQVILVPLIYFLAIMPAALAGRPLADLLTIYLGQAGSTANLLTANAPSVYALMTKASPELFSKIGVLFTGLLVLLFFLLAKIKKTSGEKNELLLYTAALSVLLIPYFLPRMHERYFYPADVLLFVLAFRWPQLWFAPVVCGLASMFSYFPFLFDRIAVDFIYLSSALLMLVVFLTYDFLTRFFFIKKIQDA